MGIAGLGADGSISAGFDCGVGAFLYETGFASLRVPDCCLVGVLEALGANGLKGPFFFFFHAK